MEQTPWRDHGAETPYSFDPPEGPFITATQCRAGPQQRQLEKGEVGQMLKVGAVEPATGERALPIVFATEKDGSIRFCVDY